MNALFAHRRQIGARRPRLALMLLLAQSLLAATTVVAQQPAAIADRQAELLARRPARLTRPPPEIGVALAEPLISGASNVQVEDLPPGVPPRMVASPSPGGDYVILDGLGSLGGRYSAGEPFAEEFDGSFSGPAAISGTAMWGRAEYLLWWVEGFSTPPLVTTSPVGTNRNDAGILGLASTTVLFGGERLNDQARSGVRLTVGSWCDGQGLWGWQASFLGLAIDRSTFAASSNTTPILARPFFNVEPGFEGQDAELIAFPGLFSGQINVEAQTTLQGVEVLMRHCLAQDCRWRIDGLAGWRFNRLHDRLTINDSRTVIGGGAGLAVGTTFVEMDKFEATNQFNGGELGVVAQLLYAPVWVEGTLKLALGGTQSQITIDGNATATIPVPGGQPQVVNTPAGLLAQGTNIGTYTATDFAVIPEIGVNVGYDITPNLRVIAGYTFMYWTGVARAGDQIDTNLNLSQLAAGGLVGIPRPQFRRITDDLWAQGLSIGLDGRF